MNPNMKQKHEEIKENIKVCDRITFVLESMWLEVV